jgi:hypothetical protein
MSELLKLIKENGFRKTDKHTRHTYIPHFYDSCFEPLKDKEINVLEIGAREGDSLKLWREYFSKADIYGIENYFNPKFSYKDVNYLFEDAYTQDVVDKLPALDVIIDDGPHTLESQIKCIELYFPKLNDSGMIIIEDIQQPSDHAIKMFEETYKKMGGTKEVEVYDGRWMCDNQDDDIIVVLKK